MKLGSKLPEVTFHNRVRDESIGGENPFRWQDQTTSDLFAGKNCLLIGLPGAFTPTCSTRQLPSYDELATEFAELGIDTIYCASVNDAFVMYQWGKALGLKNIRMIPDGSGHFTRQIGMLVNKDNLGFGHRSWRYAAVVRDGVVDGWFEEDGRCDNAADDPYEVSKPETVLEWLRGQTAEKAA
ncbi:MAG: peroxiredoxin [Rhodobacteraceae bacterium]|nr:peroxiredoxin [Paracoccaceae bacterium]